MRTSHATLLLLAAAPTAAGCAYMNRSPAMAVEALRDPSSNRRAGTVSAHAIADGSQPPSEAETLEAGAIVVSSDGKEKLCFAGKYEDDAIDSEEETIAEAKATLSKPKFYIGLHASLDELTAKSWADFVPATPEVRIISAEEIPGRVYWHAGEERRNMSHRDVLFELCVATPKGPEGARYLAFGWLSKEDLALWEVTE